MSSHRGHGSMVAGLRKSIPGQRVNQFNGRFFRCVLWLRHAICVRGASDLDIITEIRVTAVAVGWGPGTLTNAEVCLFRLFDGKPKGLGAGAPMRAVAERLRLRTSTCVLVMLTLLEIDLDGLLGGHLGCWHASS